MSAAERLRRIFARIGAEVVVAPPARGQIVLVLGDWVYDEVLLATLARRPGSVLVAATGEAVAANVGGEQVADVMKTLQSGRVPSDLAQLTPDQLAYNDELRKREPPVLMRLTQGTVDAV